MEANGEMSCLHERVRDEDEDEDEDEGGEREREIIIRMITASPVCLLWDALGC